MKTKTLIGFIPAALYAAATINVVPIQNSIGNFADIIKGFATPIGVLVFVIAGIAMMTGQQGRQWAKPTMLWTGIGFTIVNFASQIMESLSASFAGA